MSANEVFDYAAFPSEFGWIAICGKGNVLARVSAGYDSPQAAVRALNVAISLDKSNWNRALQSRLKAFAKGKRDDFLDVAIDTSHLTPFAQAVIERCRRIPFGETLSYGELAAQTGAPRGGRAVGNVMRTNCLPLVVPCHRVVLADGRLGNYSSPRGNVMKERLLTMEAKASGAHSKAKRKLASSSV